MFEFLEFDTFLTGKENAMKTLLWIVYIVFFIGDNQDSHKHRVHQDYRVCGGGEVRRPGICVGSQSTRGTR